MIKRVSVLVEYCCCTAYHYMFLGLLESHKMYVVYWA